MDETLRNEEQIAVDSAPVPAEKKWKKHLVSKGGKKRRGMKLLALLLAVAALVWGAISILGGKT